MRDLENLRQYYPFDYAVLEAVEKSIGEQQGASFSELADRYGVSGGPIHPIVSYGRPIEVLPFIPDTDYDSSHARIYRTPMAMSVSEMAPRAMRLFAADPTTQLIVVGNSAALGNSYNRLSLADCLKVAFYDARPVARPSLEYLQRMGITSTE